jgi:hypothetical protein
MEIDDEQIRAAADEAELLAGAIRDGGGSLQPVYGSSTRSLPR